jgi:uncharacterized membrane protein YcjF (UPF0283 family)
METTQQVFFLVALSPLAPVLVDILWIALECPKFIKQKLAFLG